MRMSRIWESAVRPSLRSESPGSVLIETLASAQKRAISRTTFAGMSGSETITISTRFSGSTRGRSAIVPSTLTPSTRWPVRRASSSMNPIGVSISGASGARRISWIKWTPE